MTTGEKTMDMTDDEILARADAIRSQQAADRQKQEADATGVVLDLVRSDVFKAARKAFDDAVAAAGPLARQHTELTYATDMMDRMVQRYTPGAA